MKKKSLVMVGVLLVLATAIAACQPTTAAPAEPAAPAVTVPFLDAFLGSGHADAEAEAFIHWNEDDPAEVPTSCAKCHASAGYQDFLGVDGSEIGVVDAAVPAPAGSLDCATCHNSATQDLDSVTFPSGKIATDLGPEARCLVCHQGRESKVSVDAAIEGLDLDTPSADIRFRNIHYFAAGATLYGSEAEGGYQYEGMTYDAKFDHVLGIDTCVACHNPHTLEVRVEEVCSECHYVGSAPVASVDDLKNIREPSSAVDYDGDGNTEEGMYYEIEGIQAKLYAAIQAYAGEISGTAIIYDAHRYPYYFADANANGTVDEGEGGYNAFTPRLLKAAYNYQLSQKDPGAFAHGNKYVIQLMCDSIADLNSALATPVEGCGARDDAGHFAGNTEAFRHWDDEGEVPSSCANCHSAEGLPFFIHNGVQIAQETANGFQCSTCHNSAEWPAIYAITDVAFPSGAKVSFGDGESANICLFCHQGRAWSGTIDNAVRGKEVDTPDSKIRFSNVHYFAAGATLFGNDVQGAYQYEGQTYNGLNAHPVTKCVACHDMHSLEVKVDSCAVCHGTSDVMAIRMPSTPDYDGDGDTTEGVYGEIATLADALYAQIRAYAAANSTGIVYDAHSYPYFFIDADNDGVADVNAEGRTTGYNAFTPRLLKAAYNYQYVQKDPGAFTHNPQYVVQFLIDSIADLGGDVTAYTRP